MVDENDLVKGLLSNTANLGVLQELTNAVPYLSEAEQVIVRYILRHPSEASSMSAAELATATGVSPATLFRLCKELKFSGYAELRDEVKAAVNRLGTAFIAPTLATDLEVDGLDPIQTSLYVAIRSLLDANSVQLADLERAADAIGQAQRLNICGMGPITARLAEMTAFSFQRLGLACMLWIDVQALQRDFARFTEGDVVLALSHSGDNVEVAKFLKRANNESAISIAITNYERSLIAQEAHIPLITRTRENEVQNFDLLPRLPQMLLLQVLVNLVRDKVQPDRIKRESS